MQRGCSQRAAAHRPRPTPALVQFLPGTWVYEGDYLYRGTQLTDVYRNYSFEDGNVVWVSTGEEGSRCTYEFRAAQRLALECEPQAALMRSLSVRQEGESLMIQELDAGGSALGEELRFRRIGPG